MGLRLRRKIGLLYEEVRQTAYVRADSQLFLLCALLLKTRDFPSLHVLLVKVASTAFLDAIPSDDAYVRVGRFLPQL